MIGVFENLMKPVACWEQAIGLKLWWYNYEEFQ